MALSPESVMIIKALKRGLKMIVALLEKIERGEDIG